MAENAADDENIPVAIVAPVGRGDSGYTSSSNWSSDYDVDDVGSPRNLLRGSSAASKVADVLAVALEDNQESESHTHAFANSFNASLRKDSSSSQGVPNNNFESIEAERIQIIEQSHISSPTPATLPLGEQQQSYHGLTTSSVDKKQVIFSDQKERGSTERNLPVDLVEPGRPQWDKLTVFQAAPLAWRSNLDGEISPVERIDVDRERQILSESLKSSKTIGAEIETVFETATFENFGNVVASSQCPIHISCHGRSNCIVFEDFSGGAHFVHADDVKKQLMSIGGRMTQFLFLFAEDSEVLGESFVKAGIAHVLCCREGKSLQGKSWNEFCDRFYRTLASGKSLQQAFDDGNKAVKVSLCGVDADGEAEKLILLPKNRDHDVQVFYTTPLQHRKGLNMSDDRKFQLLPRPPDCFVGRELTIYRLLLAIWSSRLVRVTGPPGIGKSALVAAACRYIKERNQSFSIETIIWLPLAGVPREETVLFSFVELFKVFEKGDDAVSTIKYEQYFATVVESFKERKTIVVIDIKDSTQLQDGVITTFIQNLLKETEEVKVIFVQRLDDGSSHEEEAEVALDPLDFEATATLFGNFCPFVAEGRHEKVCNAGQLSRLLVPNGEERMKISSTDLSRRSVDILKLIGEGIPAKILATAKKLQPSEFDELIEIAERRDFDTRTKLEVAIGECEDEIKNAEAAKERLQDLVRLRSGLLSASELRKQIADLKEQLNNASEREGSESAELRKKIRDLEYKMQKEALRS